MMSATQCRERADAMDQSAAAAGGRAEVVQWQTMATEWRRLAKLVDWQEAMLEKGHPAF